MQRDVLEQLASEILRRREDAARDAVAFDPAKPHLDLIQPAAVRRRVMHGDARMGGEPRAHGFGFVGGQIIDDEMEAAVAAPRRVPAPGM